MSSITSSRKPRYSVVIVTYNSRDNIRACLESLRGCGEAARGGNALTDGTHEVIVVDNASKDGTQDYLRAQGDIRSILNEGNNGFSKGCNQGAAIANGEFVIFLNPDTWVTKGWSDTMARHFGDAQVGAVGPVSNYVAGLQRLDLNLPPAWRDAKSFPGNGAGEVSESISRILREANGGRGIVTKLLIGFCLMMRRDRFLAMGGMDEDLFLGNDDLDLSWRLRNAGLKLAVASDAFVFHEGQKSFKTEKKSHVDRLTQESTDAMYRKLVRHYGGRDKVPSAVELWGIGWFSPSPSLVAGIDEGAVGAAIGSSAPANAGGSMMNGQRMERGETDARAEALGGAWKAITVIVHAGIAGKPGEEGAAGRLERTLGSLPARAGLEIVVLNCSGAVAAEPPEGAELRKLDLGPAFPAKQALEMGLALVPGSHLLYCAAGVEASALFNHWLDKRDLGAFGPAAILPLRIGEGEAAPGAALLCRKEWLREALASLPAAGFSAELGARASASAKPIDPPWLSARAADLPAGIAIRGAGPAAEPASANGTWTAVKETSGQAQTLSLTDGLQAALKKLSAGAAGNSLTPAAAAAALASAAASVETAFPSRRAPEPAAAHAPAATARDGIELYPESLRALLRDSKHVCFAGSKAGAPGTEGPVRVMDVTGQASRFTEQDLFIFRITPDLLDRLPERLANIRKQGTGLKRLVAVFDTSEARRLPPENGLAAIDLAPDGIRRALWEAGFAVAAERPYLGFPENGQPKAALKPGWIQIEAHPRREAYALSKKVSIVILGFNQVAYTKKCIDSIRRHTRQDYELILVDNGSKDGTEQYFRAVPGAKVIRNETNLGVAKGWNQGMRAASGEYILILNNDVIVGPDWLENMVRLAESDPSIGLVGPRSNYIAGPQVVSEVPYRISGGYREEGILPFAKEWQAARALSACEFAFIKGFCHLIPRRAFEKVGFYDERYGKGNFEDDDYCVRMRYHGFRALFANDSFIHHFGSVSFNQESNDWRALMIENQKKYEAKWAKGAAAIHETMVSVPEAGVPGPGLAPAAAIPAGKGPAQAKLKDGQAAYEAGDLEKARALFMEAQAAEPGNPDPYCSLGVVLFSEKLSTEAMSFFIRSLELDGSHADAAQNLLEVIEARGGEVSPGDAATLANRFPDNPVFRRFLSGLQASRPASADRPTVPSWRDGIESLIGEGKYAAAIDQLEGRMRRNEDPGACANFLGIIAHACGDSELALKHFRSALAHSPAETDILFNLCDTLLAVGRAEEAARLLEDSARKAAPARGDADEGHDMAVMAEQIRHALARGSVDASALLASRDANQQAERLLRAGRTEEAVEFLKAAIDSDRKDFRAFNNLGIASWYADNANAAWNFFCLALEARPAWADALVNVFDTALSLSDPESSIVLIDDALAADPSHAQALAMRRHLKAQGPAISMLRTFEALEDNARRLADAERFMEQGKQGEAIKAFLDALNAYPENPQAFNGLGVIAFAEKRLADAFGLFEMAAALNPGDQDILLNLWQCARATGREGDVLPKLRQSVDKDPALAEVKAALKAFA
jgi:GT2 family glycosyltransferase/Flp pilus assembly protein TadD